MNPHVFSLSTITLLLGGFSTVDALAISRETNGTSSLQRAAEGEFTLYYVTFSYPPAGEVVAVVIVRMTS
jgi:hypothetical protein